MKIGWSVTSFWGGGTNGDFRQLDIELLNVQKMNPMFCNGL